MDQNNQPSQGRVFDLGGLVQFDINYIINQAKLVLTDPRGCWGVLKLQPDSISGIYKRYLGPLAILAVLSEYLGNTVIGGPSRSLFGSVYRWPPVSGLIYSAVHLATMLVSFYLFAIVHETLAKNFQGNATRLNSFKLVVYSATPMLVGSLLQIIPQLTPILVLLSLYGIFVYVQGFQTMVEVADSKKWPCFAAILVCTMITAALVNMVAVPFRPMEPVNSEIMNAIQGLQNFPGAGGN